jgi:hypothetical protein
MAIKYYNRKNRMLSICGFPLTRDEWCSLARIAHAKLLSYNRNHDIPTKNAQICPVPYSCVLSPRRWYRNRGTTGLTTGQYL